MIADVGILSPGAHEKGQRMFQALGGGVMLTGLGEDHVKLRFGAEQFERDHPDANVDARFVIDGPTFVRSALLWFSDLQNAKYNSGMNFFEYSPKREVIGELCNAKLEGLDPVLSADDAIWYHVAFMYLGVAVQPVPSDGIGTSERASGKIPTRRLFYGWRMVVPDNLYDKIVGAPQIAVLTSSELKTTKGGSQKGLTSDATPLSDNLGLTYCLE
jgi:hypothetical protein